MKHSKEFYMLDAAERFQKGLYTVVGPKLGGKMIAGATGSKSEAYEQLIWVPRSNIYTYNVPDSVAVKGSAPKGLPAKNWETAVVIGSPIDDVNEILAKPGGVEAAAYKHEGVWRVGHRAYDQRLFQSLGGDMVGVALRQGDQLGEFSLGKFNSDFHHFAGALTLELIDQDVPTIDLPRQYPGIILG